LFLVYSNVYKLFLKFSVEVGKRLIIALYYVSEVRVSIGLLIAVAILVVYLTKVLDSRGKGVRRGLVRFVLGNTNLKAHKRAVSSTTKKVIELSHFVARIKFAGS